MTSWQQNNAIPESVLKITYTMASNAHWLTSGKFVTSHRESELNFVNSLSLTWDYTNLSGAERKYINAFY